jgi:DNA-binding response OmpR family regulator
VARKRIVIIEDSRVIVSIYRSKLQGEGYEIHVGADGDVGLDLIDRIEPDLVVLDLGLPKVGGIEVLQRIRAQERFGGLPVLVLSGAHSGRAVEEAWEAGATQVLSKSTDTPNRVVQLIRTTLTAA